LIAAAMLAGVVAWKAVLSAAAETSATSDRTAVQRLREEVEIATLLERLAAPAVPTATVLRKVHVVDPVAGTAAPDQSVIVSGGKIAWVGDAAHEPPVEGIRVIDGGGRYLSPGLVDMHVHSESASAWLLDLANGVTSVREMSGFPWLLDVRQHAADGRMLAPTLYVAGPILNAFPYEGYFVVPTGPLDARRLVRQQAACGYNFIKIHNVLPKPIFDAIADEAERQGMDLIGHVPHHIAVRYAVEHGMRTLEHLKGLLDDMTLQMGDTDYVAVAGPKVWVTPTLYCGRQYDEPAALQAFVSRPELRYVPARKRVQWSGSIGQPKDESFRIAERGESYRREITRRLAQTPGVQFLAGTDAAGYPFSVMGYALIEELQLLQQNGLAAPVVMRAATEWPAEAMRVSGEFGQIAPGQRADLVLLEANPLENAAAFRSNAGVMVRGRWLARAQLDSALAALARTYASSETPLIGARMARALALDIRARADRGFVFSATILNEAAAALRRAGFDDVAQEVLTVADAPSSGPCAVPAQ
jgi:imidazolonepropionase-like amidohydrolase